MKKTGGMDGKGDCDQMNAQDMWISMDEKKYQETG